jgi:hypothetical protein
MPNIPWFQQSHKPKLNNDLAGTLTAGFSRYGPNVTLSGTLTSDNPVVFIEKISADLVRRRTREKHEFTWFALLPHGQISSDISGADFQMPAKFMVTSEKPFHYHIIFVDQNTYGEIKPLLKIIRDEWELQLKKLSIRGTAYDPKKVFGEFLQMALICQISEKLQQLSYWEEGEYFVTIRVAALDPPQVFSDRRSFILTQMGVNSLRQNSLVIIKDLCCQSSISYYNQTSSLVRSRDPV